jgi:hypothetical protein
MFDFLLEPMPFDKEIYEIGYQSKNIEEAHKMAQDYAKKYGSWNWIIGLALHQAAIRFEQEKLRNIDPKSTT